METLADPTFVFGTFRLLPRQKLLLQAGDKPVQLGGRAFDLLLTLVERAGEVVGKDELLARVWPNSVVEEANLRLHITSLRKALDDGEQGRSYIKNVIGRGYCFVAPVERFETPLPAGVANSKERIDNLPISISRVIGREHLIASVANQLPLQRFITIIGPGGIGKTTVALAIAQRVRKNYQDGICFIDLAPLEDARLVPSTLGLALGLSILSSDPIPGIVQSLKGKAMLIVLDNCEHLAVAAAHLAESLLRGVPGLQILATSRERLRAQLEAAHSLPPMELPPVGISLSAKDALAFPAVQLFVERATASVHSFTLTDIEAPTVIEICLQLDGIPLAIELAASRLDITGLNDLARSLNQGLSLAMKGRRTALPRHQTLRAMLDWSFLGLEERDRKVLSRLAVFKAPFSLDRAVAISRSIDVPDWDVFDAVGNLVAKSLLTSDLNGSVTQYRLLGLTKIYCLEKLHESGEAMVVSRRHAEHFLDLLEKAELNRSDKPNDQWLSTHRSVIDEVRSALDWSYSESGDAKISVALTVAAAPLFMHYSLWEECRAQLQRAVSMLGPKAGKDDKRDMQLFCLLGAALLNTRGSSPELDEAWKTAANIAERLNDAEYRIRTLWGLWLGRYTSGDHRGALAVATKFTKLPAESTNPADILVGERLLGMTLHILGDQAGARLHIEHMLEHYVAPTNHAHLIQFQYDQRVVAKSFQAQILWLQGFPDQALRVAIAAVDEAAALGHVPSLFVALFSGACPVTLLSGDLEMARRYTNDLLDFSAMHGPWKVWGDCYSGAVHIESGNFAEGIRFLSIGLGALPRRAFVHRHVSFLGSLSIGRLRAGDPGGAMTAITEALEQSERNEDRWYVAELLRIKGEIVLAGIASGAATHAERLFYDSLEWAQRQGALAWQLRTATSLARLQQKQRRTDEARHHLSKVYAQFTEGHTRADLKAAKKLLSKLDT